MTDDADPEGAPAGPPGEDDIAERLVARVAEYDEELAHDVRRIIERGAELHSAADELEAAVEDRDDRIEDLEGAVAEREERIEELRAAVEERDGRIEDLERRVDELDDGGAPDGEDGADAAGADAAGERVAELEEQLAEREERIADLKEQLDERESEIEDLSDRLKRKQADFQNFKKRQERKREQLEERATEDLVERLLDVRDNLRRALDADHEDVASLRDGVEMTLREFDRVLEDENVTEIAPDPGEAIDPEEHEVMMRVDSPRPEDTVADLYTPGYRMADRVIRPAQVTVSTGPPEDESVEGGGEADGEEGAARATAGDAEDDDE